MSKAVQDSKELKKLKNEKMLEWLSSILNSEKSLVKLYAEHIETIKKLLKIYSELTIQRENKLQVLAKLEDISSKRKILQKFNEFFEGWNSAFETVINAIDSNPNKLSDKNSTSSGEKAGGGGQQSENTAGKQAQEALKEVRSQFSSTQKEIKKALDSGSKMEITSLQEESKLIDSALIRITMNIISLKELFKIISLDSEALQEESNVVLELLNEFSKNLKITHREWEEAKENIIFFQNYEGIVRDAICKNTENSDLKKCDLIDSNNVLN